MASAASTSSVPTAPGRQGSFDPDSPARLHPQVALRQEAFGALAYHYGNRRLVFVKSPALVDVLEDLEHHDSARAAVASRVSEPEAGDFLSAIARLYDSGVVDGR